MKNAKLSIFEKEGEKEVLVISMDDNAYLRPGTDVGTRDVKTGRIYDVADEEKQRKLPQHDLASHKFMLLHPHFASWLDTRKLLMAIHMS